MNDPQENYWKEKVKCWLCDSFIKIFGLSKYRQYANSLAQIIVGEDVYDIANKRLLNPIHEKADQIASGWARYKGEKDTFPPENENEKLSGIVDFTKNAELKHPLVKASLNLRLPEIKADSLCDEITSLIKEDISAFKGNYREIFNYLFFALPKRLKTKNVGNLGAFWEIIPEDSRIPDHNVWNHLGTVSAIGSSLKDDDDISLTVFAITPVQDFIGKARKLRDYWVGSVLLSYLSFWGIKTIAETLGPDHIVYPSLQNQTLVEEWLRQTPTLGDLIRDKEEIEKLKEKSKDIASFPNKFVFICASSDVKEVCEKVKKSIQDKWIEIGEIVRGFIKNKTNSGDKLDSLWQNQVPDFWKFSYGSCKMLEVKDKDELSKILRKDKWDKEFKTIYELAGDSSPIKMYGATHSLAQSVLAAGKTKPSKVKKTQEGEKCPLCGEHEVLHDFFNAGNSSAKEYEANVRTFWDKLRLTTNPDATNYSQTGKNERLCAICAIKRYLPIAKKGDDIILQSVLREYESYPSTTEIALYNKLKAYSADEKKSICQKIHSNETGIDESFFDIGKVGDRDKYYAFLLMDGDKMGDLINGESIENDWQDVFASELAEKFNNPDFASSYPIKDKKLRDRYRTVSPAIHSMISDALNNFARFGVKPAVENAGGKLIYAGGDDVCAIVPIDNVLKCAKDIRDAYALNFATYKDGKSQVLTSENAVASNSAIAMHLGTGSKIETKISISAAIILAHHKQPLKEVVREAHSVLDQKAKKNAGRNALALRLKKRSGGDRDFAFQWNKENDFLEKTTVLDSFNFVINAVNQGKFGQSLLYKLESLKETFKPANKNNEQLLSLIKYEVKHSGKWNKNRSKEELEADYSECAKHLAGICFHSTKKKYFTPEAPIIACFLANPATANSAEKKEEK